mmetsp:Transcript_7862/g.9012  ORF Transcript_7862/g.9012 Transcript_7862/m.9012 type:complete len:118 (-) Transcript_7862:896-1249(-)
MIRFLLLRSHAKRRSCLNIILLVLGLIGLYCVVVHYSSDIGELDRYYICSHVQGGVAKGDTWPIPSCFEDETNGSQYQGEKPRGTVKFYQLGTLSGAYIGAGCVHMLETVSRFAVSF